MLLLRLVSFHSKIKYLPSRPGERLGSTIPNNNAFKILGYKSKVYIKDYISNFIDNIDNKN